MSRRRGLSRRIVPVLAVAVLALIGAGFAFVLTAGGGRDTPATSLTIGPTSHQSSALVWVAEDRGYFRDAGLDVAVAPQPFGRVAAESLLAGDIDLAVSSDFVFVRQSTARPDLRVLASVAEIRIQEVVARQDHGIHVPADLRGKRIGVTMGSLAEFYLGRFLLTHGIDMNSVELVDFPPSEMAARLADGSIDATSTWQPHASRASQGIGANAVLLSDGLDEPYYMLLLSTADWIDAHPDAAERVINALLRAEDFVRENPEDAQQILITRLGREPELVRESWENFVFRAQMPQDLLILLEDQAAWLVERGLRTNGETPNYLDLMRPDELAAARPDAVTMIH